MAFNNPSAQLVDSAPLTFFPNDHGFQTWAFDPAHATNTYTLATGGTLYVVALKVLTRPVSNIVVDVTTAGSTLTANQCLAGVYQVPAAGGSAVLLASTADQSGVWNSTGVKTMALSASVTPIQGLVYVALVFNGTTGPTLASGATAPVNAGLAAASSRFGTANTGVTTALPATLGTVSALAQSPWVALS